MEYLERLDEQEYREQWAHFFDPYDAARDHLAEGDYLATLTAAEEALSVALATPELDILYTARSYELKARAHVGLWQYIDAENTILKGLPYADAPLQDDLNRLLAEVQGLITDNDTEREEQHIYHASPGVGPAHTLHGKVVIAYVFVDDGKHSTWSRKTQQHVLEHLQRVKAWLQARALDYGVTDLTFTDRIFQYDKDPWLRNALPDLSFDNVEIGYDLAGRVADLQGSHSVNAFLYDLTREEEADQAILLLHVNQAKRSFAHRCWTDCPDQAEYAYLLKPPKRYHWDAMGYVQAHESLHLFGADDLYNLQGGRYYAPNDIMHNYTRYIEASVIDSITAFGVGWLNEQPTPTPFPIQQAENSP